MRLDILSRYQQKHPRGGIIAKELTLKVLLLFYSWMETNEIKLLIIPSLVNIMLQVFKEMTDRHG